MALPRTVLYVHQEGSLSGSAISLANLLRGLDHQKIRARVLLGRDGPARSLFEASGAKVTVVPLHGFWTSPGVPMYHPDFYRNFRTFVPNPALTQFLRQLAPDLVHVNDKSMLGAGWAARRLGMPVVWHLRSAYAGCRSRMLAWVSRAVIARSATHAISISEDEVEGFDKAIPVSIINNSVDLVDADAAVARREAMRAELKLEDDEVAIGMIGLLTATKGAWDFIRAAGIARRTHPGAKLRFFMIAPIPGRTPLNWGWRGRLGLVDKTHPEDRARQLARDAGIEDSLVITGHRSDVLSVLAGMDVVSACYRLWAVGRPAFEGMAVGRPVIVNQGHSGRNSIVQDGVNGLVVPRGNAEALAAAIGRLATDAPLRARLGAAGYAHARKRCDPRRNAARIEAIYDHIWNSPGHVQH